MTARRLAFAACLVLASLPACRPIITNPDRSIGPLAAYQTEHPVVADSPNAKPTHRVAVTLNNRTSVASFFQSVNGLYRTQQWHLLSQQPSPVLLVADIASYDDKACLIDKVNGIDVVAKAADASGLPEGEVLGQCGWREAHNVPPFKLLASHVRPAMTPQEVTYLLGEPHKKQQEGAHWFYRYMLGPHGWVNITVSFGSGKVQHCGFQFQTGGMPVPH